MTKGHIKTPNVKTALKLFDERIDHGDSRDAALVAVSAKLLITDDGMDDPRQALSVAKELIKKCRKIDIDISEFDS